MTLRQATRYLAAVAGAAVIAASAAAQTSEPKPRPLLVGVVDLGVVLIRYERTAEISREVERDKDRFEARAKEQQRTIDAIAREVDAQPEGTAARRDKLSELRLAQKTLESMRAEGDAILRDRFEQLTLQVIDEIDAGVRAFAKERHYDMILKTTTKGWGETKLPERIYRAQVSTLVAYDKALDVTDEIVKHLNDAESLKKHAFHE